MSISRDVFEPLSTMIVNQQSEADVVTEAGGSDTASFALVARRPPRRVHLTHATWMGAVCLAVGMALGAAVSGSDAVLREPADDGLKQELRFGAASMPGHVNTIERRSAGVDVAIDDDLDRGEHEPMARTLDDERAERAESTRRKASREERRLRRSTETASRSKVSTRSDAGRPQRRSKHR
jgi:hypothetical protein